MIPRLSSTIILQTFDVDARLRLPPKLQHMMPPTI